MNHENEIRSLLRRWGNAVNKLQNIERIIHDINEELDAVADPRPQLLTGMPHSTNVGRPTEEHAFLRMTMEKNRLEDLKEEQRHLSEIIKDAEWAISFLDERAQRLIRLHYVDRLPMESIADQMHIYLRYAWKIERRSIKTIANIGKW